MRRLLTTFAVTLLTAGLVAGPALAGGGGPGNALCRGFSDGDELVMLDNCFDGVGHVVEAGTTLTVVNHGNLPHTFTAVDGSFDTGVIDPGASTEVTVDEPGTIPVHCTLHASAEGQGMAGLLVVAGGPAMALAGAETADDRGAGTWGWWLVVVAGVVLVAVAVASRVVRSQPTDQR